MIGAFPAGVLPSKVTSTYGPEVSLLMHFDGADAGTVFTDSSSYNATVTKFGIVTTATDIKKFGTASGLFGASGYLALADHARFRFGTGPFCVDYWVYMVGGGTYVLISKGSGSTIYQPYVSWFSGTLSLWLYANGAGVVGPLTIGSSGWHHIEWSRTGLNEYLFADGLLKWSVTNSTRNYDGGTGELRIGRDQGTTYSTGNRIEELQIVKGVGGHTANFTPPTAPY